MRAVEKQNKLILNEILTSFLLSVDPQTLGQCTAAFGRSLRIGEDDGQAMSKLGVFIAAVKQLWARNPKLFFIYTPYKAINS